MKNRKIVIIVLSIAIYLLSTGISYSLFTRMPSESTKKAVTSETNGTKNEFEAVVFDQDAKKTEECPLNGAKYSREQKQWWEKHRPLGVMIENHTDARPHSGLSFADTVYEAVAEGGITRFLAVFYCQDAGIVGPVRSARTYFVDFISEYTEFPLYAHVGGANTSGPADALGQVRSYDWAGYNDLDQFNVGFPTYKQIQGRNGRNVAIEHTMYSVTSKLWKVGESRSLTAKDKDGKAWDEDFVPYEFKDDAPLSDRAQSQDIHLGFWDNQPDFQVDWTYDRTNNVYLRENGGSMHKDRNTDEQIKAKNVVVLFMQENRANDGYQGNLHLVYKNKGKGKAVIFIDGEETTGTWRKDGRTDRTQLFDVANKEIEFNRGLIWFEILSLESDLQVK